MFFFRTFSFDDRTGWAYDASTMADFIVRTQALRKEFSGNPVLRDVNVGICRGEILGFIGENGAGKSTFMKILSGIHEPTSGFLESEGKSVKFRSPTEARRAGISLVPQEFNLASDLTVEENIFLAPNWPGWGGILNRKAMRSRATALLAELWANARTNDRIDTLSAAQKQLVEVCKALAFDARILILDEPTTMLTRREIDRLMALMRSLKARGMTLIYISHKLAEVKAICDRVAILKDGQRVHTAETAAIQPSEMARWMVGRELSEIYPSKTCELLQALGHCHRWPVRPPGGALHRQHPRVGLPPVHAPGHLRPGD